MRYRDKTDIEWRPIVVNGSPTIYSVSNHGSVINTTTGRVLASHKDQKGHPKITIQVNKLAYCRKVRRFVAVAFVPNDDPIGKPNIINIDGNSDNLHYSNLEWVSNPKSSEIYKRRHI